MFSCLGIQKFPMVYLRSLVIGVILSLSYTCNGQVYCGWWSCPDNTDCEWLGTNRLYCECKDGYRLNSNEICVDIKECSWDICGQWECEDRAGTYRCNNGCRNGYTHSGGVCYDIDECDFPVCGPTGNCVNRDGLYSCNCYSGYHILGGRCEDRNECSSPYICGSPLAGQCVNTVGSYRCECYHGYTLNNNTCTDDDECSTPDLCGSSSAGQCVNIPGSYNCNCSTGYKLQVNGVCADIDECPDSEICGPPSAGWCVNVPGSYSCNCSSGYKLKDDGECADVNECQASDLCGPTSAGQCVNIPGTYNCICSTGYNLEANDKCADIDECQSDGPCDHNAQCANFPGDYNCTCNTGFSGDGKNCTADAHATSSLTDSPGIIVGIAAGGLLIVVAITLITVLFIARRNRNKHKREDLSPSNRTIDQEPSYVNVRMSDVNSEGNNNGGEAGVDNGDVNDDALGELYSNNLVKERKKQQQNQKGTTLPDDDAVIYSNEQPENGSGDGYDTLWKPSSLQQNLRPIVSPDEETYNHLHHKSLAIPTTVGGSTGASLYNHLYSGGNVQKTQVTSKAGQDTVEGNDEYSLAL